MSNQNGNALNSGCSCGVASGDIPRKALKPFFGGSVKSSGGPVIFLPPYPAYPGANATAAKGA